MAYQATGKEEAKTAQLIQGVSGAHEHAGAFWLLKGHPAQGFLGGRSANGYCFGSFVEAWELE